MKKYNIGFMQGRLVPKIDNQIQKFPKKNWLKEIKIARKENYNIMEWTIDNSCLLTNPIIKNYKLVKKNLKKFNLNVDSITCDFYMQKPIHKNNNIKLIKKYQKIFNNLLKTKIKLVVIPLVDNSKIIKKKDEDLTVNFFMRDILPLLKKYKKKIVFELDFEPKKTLLFIKKFSKKFFGINYDTGNSAAMGFDIEDEFKLYGSYIDNIHIKDRVLNGYTVRLGHGQFRFDKLKKMLMSINYKNNLILQTARASKNSHIRELNRNLAFLKKYL